MSTRTELIPYQTITTITAQYATAQADVAEAYRLLQQAKEQLQSTFGETFSTTVIPSRASDYDIERTSRQASEQIRRKAWRYILEQTGIKSLLSACRQEQLQRQLSEGNMPEVTRDNVMGTLEGFMQDAESLLDELIGEVFDLLRPCHRRYRSNSRFEIGLKVILQGPVEYCSHTRTFRVDYCHEPSIRSIDTVFHLLDGKGAAKYPSDLLTAMKAAIKNEQQNCDTAYFSVRWFKAGTLHLVIKRQDLLMALNARAGGCRLRQ